MSLGVACHFFNEHNALPGFLEMASQFFDQILMVDCGPNGTRSSDGSLDILRKWGIEPLAWRIDSGFGAVRTQLLHTSRTDWTIIADADERFFVTAPILDCDGNESYPQVPKPNLAVRVVEPCFNHKDFLLSKIREADEKGFTGVRFCRRHWFDATYRRPTQNWMSNRDWQLRCLKTLRHIGYKSETRMHEQAWDFKRNCGPQYIEDDPHRGPFVEHLHCHFKPMEKDQREQDIRIYDALHYEKTGQVWKELGYA